MYSDSAIINQLQYQYAQLMLWYFRKQTLQMQLLHKPTQMQ